MWNKPVSGISALGLLNFRKFNISQNISKSLEVLIMSIIFIDISTAHRNIKVIFS